MSQSNRAGSIRNSPAVADREGKQMRSDSESDERVGQAVVGAVQEKPHAQGLGALDGHQAHVAANMVSVNEECRLCFVAFRVRLKLGDALFKRLAEVGTDFIAICCGGFCHHGRHLVEEIFEAEKYFNFGLMLFLPVPILMKSYVMRQITDVGYERNGVS
jgi:hypothetical protein